MKPQELHINTNAERNLKCARKYYNANSSLRAVALNSVIHCIVMVQLSSFNHALLFVIH